MPIVPAPTSSEPVQAPKAEALIPLSVPVLGGREWEYLKECLETGWVSSAGPFVERFEEAVASGVGATHAVAAVNGTSALHTALQVVGVQPDEEVLVSDLTFVAPVNAIRYCQAHPVLIDADPDTWQMDVGSLERFLARETVIRGSACYNAASGRRIRAILPVHILGLCCAMDQIVELARQFHLCIVEDAAEAMGVRYQGRHAGTFGDAGVFSFNGNKIVTSGGGGMVVTNDAALAARARYLTTQAKDDELESVHEAVGYNYRLSNLHAALGLAQLERLEAFIAKKRAIARRYEEALRDVTGITLMPVPADVEPTYWLYTIVLSAGTLASRKATVQQLRAAGIEARPLWHPIHGLRPYRGCQVVGGGQAQQLYERGISLPSGVGLTEPQQHRCIAAVKQAVEQS